jgi:hypothetical protein
VLQVTQQARAYNNLDARRISNAEAVARSKDNQGGWQNDKRDATADAAAARNAASNGKQNAEFDSFQQNANQRQQQLWDQARHDLNQRARGSDKERAVDASFLFTPDSSVDPFGLGTSQTTAFGQGRGVGFATQPQGFSDGNSNFDTPVGAFMQPIGSSQFGQTHFGGQTNFGGSAQFSGANTGATGFNDQYYQQQ